MATALMNMDLPTVSSTLGTAWATMLNAALELVDAHDHSSGKGGLVPAAGLNINSDLSFGSNNATLMRSVRFASQSAALAVATDLGCIYRVGEDLYWNNGSGTAVQITSGASVNAGAGSIAGLPSGTASASFNSATGTFSWRQATDQAATMDVGPLVIRHTAASALGITLQSPSGLAAAYSITLPSALPGATRFLRMTAAGVLAADVAPDGSTLEVSGADLRIKDLGVATAKIAANAVTRAKMASVGQQLSSAASVGTSSTSWVNLTGLTVTLTTTGRPIVIMTIADDGSSDSRWSVTTSVTGTATGGLRIAVSGSATANVGSVLLGGNNSMLDAGEAILLPPSSLFHFYAPGAGTYTFQLQGIVNLGTTTIAATALKLVAYEL